MFDDPTGDSLNYTWKSNAWSTESLYQVAAVLGNDGATTCSAAHFEPQFVTNFPVSVTVYDANGGRRCFVSPELMLQVWNDGSNFASTTESGLASQLSTCFTGHQLHSPLPQQTETLSYENLELPGFTGRYDSVERVIDYSPATIYSANDVLASFIDVSVNTRRASVQHRFGTSTAQVHGLSLAEMFQLMWTHQRVSSAYIFPENSPVLSAGTLVLIGDSMSPIAPPDATISGLTAYQSSDYGAISMSWQVSGTYLGSDVIQVTICQDDLNCENAFSASLAIGDVNFVYSGSNTRNGSMYSITVEICNEENVLFDSRAGQCARRKRNAPSRTVRHSRRFGSP